MTHDSLWQERARAAIQAGDLPDPSADQLQEWTAIVLGLTYSELRTYLAGDVVPPEEVVLRTLELVVSRPVNDL